jgi:hypothetical protein
MLEVTQLLEGTYLVSNRHCNKTIKAGLACDDIGTAATALFCVWRRLWQRTTSDTCVIIGYIWVLKLLASRGWGIHVRKLFNTRHDALANISVICWRSAAHALYNRRCIMKITGMWLIYIQVLYTSEKEMYIPFLRDADQLTFNSCLISKHLRAEGILRYHYG